MMGSHTLNIAGGLMKIRLDKNGKVIGEDNSKGKEVRVSQGHDHGNDDQPEYELVKAQVVSSEGCKVKGNIIVNKVYYF